MEELLTVQELAKVLHIRENTVYELIKKAGIARGQGCPEMAV